MTTKDTDRNDCGRGELLVAVLYGEATAAERDEFEAHRRACAACDEELSAFAGVREELRAWELDAVPHVKVEIRPGFVERLRRAFAIMPLAARVAAAGACALLVLALANAEVSVGSGGVSVRFGVLPKSDPQVAVAPPPTAPEVSDEQVRRIVEERVDATVRAQLAAYREDMDAQLKDFETRLASATSADDVRKLTLQVSTQRKRIEQLQRDVDRTAGYGGADLFGAVLSPADAGGAEKP